MSILQQRLQARLAERREQSLYRQRLTLDSAQGRTIRVNGDSLLCFCSNDYLGLANHPRLVQAQIDAVQQYGTGSGASHLVVGHSRLHHELEDRLAALTGRSRALLFSSGYMANLGVITTLVARGDSIFEDRLNHASLLDGGLLSGARFKRFAHNDCAALEAQLQKAPAEVGKLVVVDAVYSMDGDRAPLVELAHLCEQYQATLMADDAHGLGVFGPEGAGTVADLGLSVRQVPVLMGTLGKALGTAGAFVAGDDELIESLVQFARSYIYTTAIPPATAAATLAALDVLREENWRQQHLHRLISIFQSSARQRELPIMASDSAIQPLLVGDAGKALQISERLREQGVLVTAIRPPTVPAGTARLRVALSAAHQESDIEQLVDALSRCWH